MTDPWPLEPSCWRNLAVAVIATALNDAKGKPPRVSEEHRASAERFLDGKGLAACADLLGLDAGRITASWRGAGSVVRTRG